MTRALLDLDRSAVREAVAALHEKPFRVDQLWQWLHEKRAGSFEEMTNLSKDLRSRLAASYAARTLQELDHRISSDGLTEKWLFAAPPVTERNAAHDDASAETHRAVASGAQHLVETVLIRERRRTRATVCLSVMVGCPLGCVFCATGQAGFVRNLSTGEMLEQVYRVDARLRACGEAGVTHAVFMGMGEPLVNLDAVVAAAGRLTAADGLDLAGRHVTVSTVGVPAGIDRLARSDLRIRLAVSLHAPNQALRETLVPAARRWPLPELMAAVRRFAKGAGRPVTFEYCLIDRVNASRAHAEALAHLLAGLPCKVNLIPLNPVAGYEGRPAGRRTVDAFQTVLERAGLTATVRTEKGQDIHAACGQLRGRHEQAARGGTIEGDCA